MPHYGELQLKEEDLKGFPYNLTAHNKKKSGAMLAKKMIDYYLSMYEPTADRVKRHNENWELHRGSWSAIEDMGDSRNFSINKESIMIQGSKLRHYPLLNIVSQSIVGEIISSPLISTLRDNSSRARNHRDRVRTSRLKQKFQLKFVDPVVQRVRAEYFGGVGVSDPSKLSQEELATANKEIQKEIKNQTAQEIEDSMARYKTPDEILGQTLLRHMIDDLRVKDKFDIGGENAVVVGEEYYRVSILNGLPHFETLNPKFVYWQGSEHCEYAEDGEFAIYEQYITLTEALSRYSLEIKPNEIKDLVDWYSPIPGTKSATSEELDLRITDIIGNNPELNDPKSKDFLDPYTKDGQNKLQGIYTLAGAIHRNGWGIKESYVTWKWTRKMKEVHRLVEGEVKIFIRDEHYKKNTLKGDLKIIPRLIPQVWEGVRLGELQNFYVNVRPVAYQYENLENPFRPKLTIYGGKFNTFQNNAKNISIVDLGKPLQYRYNAVMAKMEEHEAMDIGKVIFGTSNLKPDSMSWSQWYKSIFIGKFAQVNTHYEGLGSQDRRPFWIEDLSRTSELGADMQKLEYLERNLWRSMYYNSNKFGQISQYANTTNIQAGIAGADRQLTRFHNRHRIIKERVLNGLLNMGITAYKDYEYLKDVLFDDYTKLFYDGILEPFQIASFSLYVVDDFKEQEKVNTMKSLALSIIQNGGSSRDISAVINSRSMAEIDEVLEQSELSKQRAAKETFERDKELQERNAAIVEAQTKLQQEFMSAEAERDRQVKLAMGELNAQFMQRANDINENKTPDSLERVREEIISREKIEGMKDKTKRYAVEEKTRVTK